MFAFSLFLILSLVGIANIIDWFNKNENSQNHYYNHNKNYSRNEYHNEKPIIWEDDEGYYYPDEDSEDDFADRWGPYA